MKYIYKSQYEQFFRTSAYIAFNQNLRIGIGRAEREVSLYYYEHWDKDFPLHNARDLSQASFGNLILFQAFVPA